jgi:hypothetical protein
VSLLGNALTWTVGSKGRTAGKPTTGAHRSSRCRDRDCLRPPCVAYREGREDGYEDGHERGYEDGWADGYRAGTSATAGR